MSDAMDRPQFTRYLGLSYAFLTILQFKRVYEFTSCSMYGKGRQPSACFWLMHFVKMTKLNLCEE